MTSLYDILKARKGLPVSDSTALLFGRQTGGGGGSDVEYFGAVPFEINAKGTQNAKEYTIYGNTYQAAVPTPEQPVKIQGVGDYDEETGKYKIPVVSEEKNLFDGKYNVGYTGQYPNISEDSTGCSSEWIETNKIDNTIKIILSINTEGNYVFGYVVSNDKEQILYRQGVSNTGSQEVNAKRVVTLMESTINTIKSYKFVKFYYSRRQYFNYYGVYFTNETEYTPYRPPITTTLYLDNPLYKGDFVKKDTLHRAYGVKFFDGSESWSSNVYMFRRFYTILSDAAKLNPSNTKSTHYQGGTQAIDQTIVFSNNAAFIYEDRFESVEQFKEYLAEQYTNGTPVTIVYPLATPTEKSVDLPNLQLADGFNSIDVDTSVKPESMQIKFKGDVLSQQASLMMMNESTEDTNDFEESEEMI